MVYTKKAAEHNLLTGSVNCGSGLQEFCQITERGFWPGFKSKVRSVLDHAISR